MPAACYQFNAEWLAEWLARVLAQEHEVARGSRRFATYPQKVLKTIINRLLAPTNAASLDISEDSLERVSVKRARSPPSSIPNFSDDVPGDMVPSTIHSESDFWVASTVVDGARAFKTSIPP
jgi:hypothetical protein